MLSPHSAASRLTLLVSLLLFRMELFLQEQYKTFSYQRAARYIWRDLSDIKKLTRKNPSEEHQPLLQFKKYRNIAFSVSIVSFVLCFLFTTPVFSPKNIGGALTLSALHGWSLYSGLFFLLLFFGSLAVGLIASHLMKSVLARSKAGRSEKKTGKLERDGLPWKWNTFSFRCGFLASHLTCTKWVYWGAIPSQDPGIRTGMEAIAWDSRNHWTTARSVGSIWCSVLELQRRLSEN